MQQKGESFGKLIPQILHLIRIQLRIAALHPHVFDREEGTCQNIQSERTGSPRINVRNRTKKITRGVRKNSDQLPKEEMTWTLLFCSGPCYEIDDS